MLEILKSYQILGVEPSASSKAIKKAYREKVKEWHPDQFQDSPSKRAEAEEKLRELNLAFEYIQDYREKHPPLPRVKFTPPTRPPAPEPKPQPQKPKEPDPIRPQAQNHARTQHSSANPKSKEPPFSRRNGDIKPPPRTGQSFPRRNAILAGAAGLILIGIAIGMFATDPSHRSQPKVQEPTRVYLSDLQYSSQPNSAETLSVEGTGTGSRQDSIKQALAGILAADEDRPHFTAGPKATVSKSPGTDETHYIASARPLNPPQLKQLLKDKLETPAASEVEAPTGDTAEDHFHRGLRYANGSGVPQDYTEAAKWYLLAAEAGHAEAQRNLGFLYSVGKGVNQDQAEADKWLRKAAAQGSSSAELASAVLSLAKKSPVQATVADHSNSANERAAEYYNRGLKHATGDGVPLDHTEAAKWYMLAAEAGHADAQKHLGYLFSIGKGVPQNASEAQKWFQKAASQGNLAADLAKALLTLGQHDSKKQTNKVSVGRP